MKCPHCSAPLMIEDEVCRYCGKENPYFTEHRAQMKEFTEDFAETQQEVVEAAKKTTHFTASIAVVCALAALNLLILLGFANLWDIQGVYENWYTNQHATEIRATLETYSDAQDPIGMYHYHDATVFGSNNDLDDYDSVYWVVWMYSILHESIVEIAFYQERSYQTVSELAEDISDYLSSYYRYATQEDYDDPAEFSAEHQATIDMTTARLEAMIETYLGIPAEEIPALMELSDARRAIAIEEGVLGHEAE